MKKTFAWYSNLQTTSRVMSPSDTTGGRPILGWETVAQLLDMLLVVCCRGVGKSSESSEEEKLESGFAGGLAGEEVVELV